MSRLPLGALSMIALALSACAMNRDSPAGTWGAPLARQRAASSASKISHVIVVVQENRSFENFFAGYPGANAPTSGCASPSPPPRMHGGTPPDVRPLASGSGCPGSDVLVPLHQVSFENNADLRHDWRSSMTDWNNGQMDGFSAWGMKHGRYSAYAYLKHSEIEPYWTMANQYVLADAMFPTEFGGSFTGHLTLIAGTDDLKPPRHAEVDFPSRAPDDCDSPPGTKSSYLDSKRRVHRFNGPFPCFDQFNTIAQVLDNAGVSWKIYATRVLDGGFWEPFEEIKYVRYGHDFKTNIIAPQRRFFGNARHGKLASVDWVIPTKIDSDHPGNGSDTGPSWVASIVNAVGESAYWPTSAIIVVWDDWGGFYDNAAPPQLDYRGLGIRVPCLIISPYAKAGYVSHVQYEYGSILRFIEEVYGFPAGSIGPTSEGYTDARANSLDDAFDFAQTPRPFVPIGSKYSTSHFLHEPPSNEPADTQ